MATKRALRKFPSAEYAEYTEAQYRMLVFVTVLQRNLDVRYNPACMTGPYDATDARNHFIHGPLEGHGGTCSSLPVLYIAIARRLGYPLRLVAAKEHWLTRWDGGGERFNIEATRRGFTALDDRYYYQWPFPLTDVELGGGDYLVNKSPRQELGCFLHQRGMCWLDNLRLPEALHALSLAACLDRAYRGSVYVAQVIRGMLCNLHAGGLPRDWPLEKLVGLVTPKPNSAAERWAVPIAREELIRILGLASKRASEDNTFHVHAVV